MSLVSLLMLLTVSNTSIISCQLLSVAHCFTSLDLLGSPGHRPTKDQTGGFPSLSVQILGTLDLRLQRLIDTKSKSLESLESLEPLESLVFGKHFRLHISSAYDWSRKPKKSPDLPPGDFLRTKILRKSGHPEENFLPETFVQWFPTTSI